MTPSVNYSHFSTHPRVMVGEKSTISGLKLCFDVHLLMHLLRPIFGKSNMKGIAKLFCAISNQWKWIKCSKTLTQENLGDHIPLNVNWICCIHKSTHPFFSCCYKCMYMCVSVLSTIFGWLQSQGDHCHSALSLHCAPMQYCLHMESLI